MTPDKPRKRTSLAPPPPLLGGGGGARAAHCKSSGGVAAHRPRAPPRLTRTTLRVTSRCPQPRRTGACGQGQVQKGRSRGRAALCARAASPPTTSVSQTTACGCRKFRAAITVEPGPQRPPSFPRDGLSAPGVFPAFPRGDGAVETCVLRRRSGTFWVRVGSFSPRQRDSCVNLKVEHWRNSRRGVPWLPRHTGFTFRSAPRVAASSSHAPGAVLAGLSSAFLIDPGFP